MKHFLADFLFVVLIVTIIVVPLYLLSEQARQDSKFKSTTGSIKWEKIVDSSGLMSPIYRARIYGGWLVNHHGNIIFVATNHPDN